MSSLRQLAIAVVFVVCCRRDIGCKAGDDDEGTCPADDPGCASREPDTYTDPHKCEAWAKKCECLLNPRFMLRQCARSCRLHGGGCLDNPDCAKLSPAKACTPKDWGSCPKACKLIQKKRETKKCVRIETPGGMQDISVPAMFERIEKSPWAEQYGPQVLSRDPWIVYLDSFLSHEQVDGLMAAIEESKIQFSPSYELQAGHSQRRKSESMFCSTPACYDDPRVKEVHDVASNITGLALPNHEYMQIVKYRAGDFYVTHQDTSNEYGQSAAGHRIYTLFVYLSDMPEGSGGETNFPALKLSVAPKKGAAVLWSNVKADNPRWEDKRSDHQGSPVKNVTVDGQIVEPTKLGANMWLYGYDWRTNFRKGCMNKDAGY